MALETAGIAENTGIRRLWTHATGKSSHDKNVQVRYKNNTELQYNWTNGVRTNYGHLAVQEIQEKG